MRKQTSSESKRHLAMEAKVTFEFMNLAHQAHRNVRFFGLLCSVCTCYTVPVNTLSLRKCIIPCGPLCRITVTVTVCELSYRSNDARRLNSFSITMFLAVAQVGKGCQD